MEQKLGALRIEGNKIFARLSRFHKNNRDYRQKSVRQQEEKRAVKKDFKEDQKVSGGEKRKNFTYADAVRADLNKQNKQESKEESKEQSPKVDPELMTVVIEDYEKRVELLKKKYVGEVKNMQSLSCITAAFFGEGFGKTCIDYLGGLWVLISLRDNTETENLLSNTEINSWFNNLCPWDASFQVNERIVCLNIEGIPLIAWTQKIFTSIASTWGEVLLADNCLFGNKDCSSSHVWIKTQHCDFIRCSKSILLNCKNIIIRISEVGGVEFGKDPLISVEDIQRQQEKMTENKKDNEVDLEKNHGNGDQAGDEFQSEYSSGDEDGGQDSEGISDTIFGNGDYEEVCSITKEACIKASEVCRRHVGGNETLVSGILNPAQEAGAKETQPNKKTGPVNKLDEYPDPTLFGIISPKLKALLSGNKKIKTLQVNAEEDMGENQEIMKNYSTQTTPVRRSRPMTSTQEMSRMTSSRTKAMKDVRGEDRSRPNCWMPVIKSKNSYPVLSEESEQSRQKKIGEKCGLHADEFNPDDRAHKTNSSGNSINS